MAGRRFDRADGRTCAEGLADYSLCGDAMEGDEPNGLAHVICISEQGPVTCETCCDIINLIRHDFRHVKLDRGANQ